MDPVFGRSPFPVYYYAVPLLFWATLFLPCCQQGLRHAAGPSPPLELRGRLLPDASQTMEFTTRASVACRACLAAL